MFNVRFYKFNKKSNSTKKPGTTDSYITMRCNVKTSSSIINPVLEIQYDNVPGWNYCYIEEFGRYYFISDVVSASGLWIISTVCDVLASYQDDILNSRQYVMRSASDYDGDLIDTLYQTGAMEYVRNVLSTSVQRYNTSTGQWSDIISWFNRQISSGGIVFGIFSGNSTGVTYYMTDTGAFRRFMAGLLSFDWKDGATASDALLPDSVLRAMTDPIQYITSVRWFPTVISFNNATQVTDIMIGARTMHLTTDLGLRQDDIVYVLNQLNTERFRFSIDIPRRNSASSYPYLNYAPYSQYNLYFQPFGDIPLDSVKMAKEEAIVCEWVIDYTTGSTALQINGSTSGCLIYSTVSDIGVTFPISGISVSTEAGLALAGISYLKTQLDRPSLLSGAVQGLRDLGQGISNAIVSASTGERMFAAQPSNVELLDKVGNTIQASMGQVSSKGVAESFLSYNMGLPFIYAWFTDETDHDDARFGRPLCQSRRLDNLTGFCLCADAYIDYTVGSPTEPERAQIAAILDSGVYLE